MGSVIGDILPVARGVNISPVPIMQVLRVVIFGNGPAGLREEEDR